MSSSLTLSGLFNNTFNLLQSYIKPKGTQILTFIGLFYLTSRTLCALKSFSRTFLLSSHNLAQRYGPGSWALVTGAAQGIGAAYASQLASKGFNLVLIDFDEKRLAETKAGINTNYPQAQVKTIICDFSKSLQEGFFDSIMEQINGLDISILVNNVGTGVVPGPINEVPEQAMLNTIKVNTIPVSILTRRLVPQMLKRPTRSAIINMSSVSSIHFVPWLATYSATKAYIDVFTRAIEKDVSHKIDVLSVRPAAVSTAMIKNPKLEGGVLSGEDVAKAALSKVGRTLTTHGHWKHEVAAWMARNDTVNKYGTMKFFHDILGVPEYK